MKRLFLLLLLCACSDKFDVPEDSAVDPDGDGYSGDDDCDETNRFVNAGAEELCDGIDNDCDGEVDVGATDQTLWYADEDGDGEAGANSTLAACEAPEGYSGSVTDCDDSNAEVHPGALEICDGIDNDCDGLVDADDPQVDLSTAMTWYPDADTDGYGDESGATVACSPPDDHVLQAGDCDDGDPELNPETWWYPDADGDGYGDSALGVQSCEQPGEWIREGTDCFDYDVHVHPGATEVCNGTDDDCDRLVDDADDSVDPASMNDWYVDGDRDGYGDSSLLLSACDAPPGTSAADGDCDDGDLSVHPGATEVCNDGLDNDCDGTGNDCGVRGVLSVNDADAAWTGSSASDYLGQVLDIVGDVDGDGYDDAILGGYGRDIGNNSSAGAVYVVYGGASLSGGDASTLPSWYGETGSDYLGYQVAGLGDLDGDGLADYGFGAYGEDASSSSAGAAFLVYGDSARITGQSPGSSADAMLLGAVSADYAGHCVASAGDVDGDGYDDVLVGAYGAEDGTGPTSQGAVYLAYGGTTRYAGASSLGDYAHWFGESTSDYLGYRYSMGSGDFNGDGLSDLSLGAYGTNGNTTSSLGQTYIVYGDTARYSGGSSISGADVVFGAVESSGDVGFGYSTAGLSDFNGDGIDDLVIGGHYHDSSTVTDVGAMWVFLGDSAGWNDGTDADADMFFEGANLSDYLGRDVDGAGDLDGDGLSELVTGVYGWDSPLNNAGAAVVWYGRAAASGTYTLTDAEARVEGGAVDSWTGYGVAGGGDLNGDGLPDLMVGAFGVNNSAGAVYLFLGGSL